MIRYSRLWPEQQQFGRHWPGSLRPGRLRSGRQRVRLMAIAVLLPLVMAYALPRSAHAAPTTNLTIRKVASDGTTILAEKTVDYTWLMDEENIPVLGDGVTRYYHQGPVFVSDPDDSTQEMLRWNPEEDTNVDTKDMGALKGSNVKDLCDLVGGMEEGDRLNIKASDGLNKTFAYENVYLYSEREGPMVICWCKDGQFPDDGYRDGMRLVWFADDSTNPWGLNVFGNWDWHEAADEQYWYFFRTGDQMYPTTTGLSIQTVSVLTILSSLPAQEADPEAPADAFDADDTEGVAPDTLSSEGTSSGGTQTEEGPAEETPSEDTPTGETEETGETQDEAQPDENSPPPKVSSRSNPAIGAVAVIVVIAAAGAAIYRRMKRG